MAHMPTLLTLMTPFPFSISETATLAQAREMMDAHRFHHLPVMEGGVLTGVISGRDVAIALAPGLGGRSADKIQVGDVMTPHPYVVEISEPLDQVLEQMARQHIGSAVVVKHGKLAGIFTVTDVCRVFSEHLRKRFAHQNGNDVA